MTDRTLTTTEQTQLARPLSLDQRPGAIYLAGLNTQSSRRTMRQALNKIAHLVSDGQADALQLLMERIALSAYPSDTGGPGQRRWAGGAGVEGERVQIGTTDEVLRPLTN